MHNLQLQSPFFTRLPTEIRLRIYDHYGLQRTFDSTAFYYSYYNEKLVPSKLYRRLPPPLLRTCKRAYAEARSSVVGDAVLQFHPGIKRNREILACSVRVPFRFELGVIRSLYITYTYKKDGFRIESELECALTRGPSFFLEQVKGVRVVHLHFIVEGHGPEIIRTQHLGIICDIIFQLRKLEHLVLSGYCPQEWRTEFPIYREGVKIERVPRDEKLILPGFHDNRSGLLWLRRGVEIDHRGVRKGLWGGIPRHEDGGEYGVFVK